MYNNLMTSINASDARATLPQLLDRVTSGEEVTITRHGRPVAVLVRPDRLRVRRTSTSVEMASHVRRLLHEARDLPVDAGEGLSAEYAEELVADVRASRRASDR